MMIGGGSDRSGSDRALAGQTKGLQQPSSGLDTVFKGGLQYSFDLLSSY